MGIGRWCDGTAADAGGYFGGQSLGEYVWCRSAFGAGVYLGSAASPCWRMGARIIIQFSQKGLFDHIGVDGSWIFGFDSFWQAYLFLSKKNPLCFKQRGFVTLYAI